MSPVYDLIIIGTGSVGSAAAYYASKEGLKVLMIDKYTPPHTRGSHHGATRMIRYAYGEGGKYVPLIRESKRLWDEIIAVTTPDIFTKCGLINTGPKGSEFITNCVKSAEKYNLKASCLNSKEIHERWPGLVVPDDYIGVYDADSGCLYSELVVKHLIRLAKENGAEELFNCEVKSVKEEQGLVKVLTDKGVSLVGKKVAMTPGTWIKKLVPNLPIKPIRKVVAWHEADSRYDNFPMYLVEYKGEMFYGFPRDENGFKVGNHLKEFDEEAVEDMAPYGSVAEDTTETNEYVQKFMPGVGKVLKGITCSYDMSPDHDFIIDTVPGTTNILMIAGLSGHGFKFAPVLGKIVNSFAQSLRPDCDISMFSLKRFPAYNTSKL